MVIKSNLYSSRLYLGPHNIRWTPPSVLPPLPSKWARVRVRVSCPGVGGTLLAAEVNMAVTQSTQRVGARGLGESQFRPLLYWWIVTSQRNLLIERSFAFPISCIFYLLERTTNLWYVLVFNFRLCSKSNDVFCYTLVISYLWDKVRTKKKPYKKSSYRTNTLKMY